MKIAVILEGMGGELDREEREIDAAQFEDVDQAVDVVASGVIEGWVLSVGDTIRIVEVA